MKLVLQCAMCGTHHPVGTVACSTCRAEGVTQLRLMFECQQCGRLGLAPQCASCPPALPPTPAFEVIPAPIQPEVFPMEPLELEDLIVAEGVEQEDGLSLDLNDEDESKDLDEDDELDFDSDLDDDQGIDLDLENLGDLNDETDSDLDEINDDLDDLDFD